MRSGNMKLKWKIACLIMEVELQSKHLERQKLKWEMIKICHQMKEDMGLILLNTVNYYLNKVIAKTLIKVKHSHEKKLVSLRQHKRKLYGESNTLFIRSTVDNYSSYNLSIEEDKALSFGLDQHIATTLNGKNLHMEFEYFYKNITNDILHLSEDDVFKLKRNSVIHAKNVVTLKFCINIRGLLTV